ncbi:hypothetical protein AOLI_G00158360 [Acnodon oligacanthus]
MCSEEEAEEWCELLQLNREKSMFKLDTGAGAVCHSDWFNVWREIEGGGGWVEGVRLSECKGAGGGTVSTSVISVIHLRHGATAGSPARGGRGGGRWKKRKRDKDCLHISSSCCRSITRLFGRERVDIRTARFIHMDYLVKT